MAIKASNQISIVDVTDAYSVILTSEAYTFVGGTGGAASGGTCSTQAVAYCGSSQCQTVSVDQNAITCPSGISAAVTNNNTSAVTITFSLTATLSEAAEATIPVVVDGITVNKKFSFAVAKTGQTGNTGRGISSTVIEYQSSSGNTTPPTGTWSTTIPSVSAGQYLWTRTTINYTSGDPTISYSVAKQGSTGTVGSQWYAGTGITGTSTTPTVFSGSGVSNARVNDQYLNTSTGNTYICTTAGAATAAKWKYTGNIKGIQGETGDDGNGISGATIQYASSTSNTTAPSSGWQNTPPSVAAGSYLWTRTVFSYTDGTSSDPQYSVAKQGATGSPGADAITVSITSSNGTVFKNNSGSTVLTAHVYKAGTEKTVNASTGVVADSLGTIKWYKGSPSDTQPSGFPKAAGTLTVGASDVANVQAYTCQLES